jgi:hypothetical protein
MTPTRRQDSRRGSLWVATLLAGAALSGGCGSDGAGTIHIESSKSRREMLQTGAGLAAIATAQRQPAGIPGKSAPRPAIKKLVGKRR